MNAQPQEFHFTEVDSVNTEAFSEGRVAVIFGNYSGLGVENTWYEVRKEPSSQALGYLVFDRATSAQEFCKKAGTVSNVPADVQRRWEYIMRGVA